MKVCIYCYDCGKILDIGTIDFSSSLLIQIDEYHKDHVVAVRDLLNCNAEQIKNYKDKKNRSRI